MGSGMIFWVLCLLLDPFLGGFPGRECPMKCAGSIGIGIGGGGGGGSSSLGSGIGHMCMVMFQSGWIIVSQT